MTGLDKPPRYPEGFEIWPVYPHGSREWWQQMAFSLDKLGCTYKKRNLWRWLWLTCASVCRWRAEHA